MIIERAVLRNERGQETNMFRSGKPIRIEIYYNALKKIDRPNFWISVTGRSADLFGASMLYDEACPEYIEGKGCIACTFKDIRLIPMSYSISMGIRGKDAVSNHIPATEISYFTIEATTKELGFSDNAANFYNAFWPLLIPYEWQLPDGKVVKVNDRKENS